MYEILKNVLKYYSLQNLISLIKDKTKRRKATQLKTRAYIKNERQKRK